MARQKKDKAVDALASGQGYGSTYVENQIWSLLPPWIAAIVIFIGGGVGHGIWGDASRAPWVTAFLSASTVLLTMLALVVGRARDGVVRLMSALSTALSGAWLTAVVITGYSGPTVWLYPLGALLICIAWNVRKLLNGQGQDAHNQGGVWSDVADKVKILKSAVIDQRRVGASHRVTLELEPGQTQAGVQGDAAALAGMFETPPGGVQVIADPDNARKVVVNITPADILKVTVAWRGPSAPGTSIADAPILLGDYQDGEPMSLLLPGKRGVKVVSHILIMGMSGAGKSEGIQVFVVECLTRTDVEVEYIDAGGKAEQTVGPIRSGLTRLSTSLADAQRHLAALEREVAPRAAHLAARGCREWEKGCGLSFKVVVIDEGADLVPNNAAFTRLARKLRSVGIILVLAIQRATHNQIPTEARANFGTVICFGVRRPDDAGFALSDETIEAGANPAAWANRKPGYSYIEDNGIDEMRFPIPGRFFLAAPEDVERIVTQAAPLRWTAAQGVEAYGTTPSGALVPDDSEEGEIVDPDAPVSDDSAPPADAQEDAQMAEETRAAAYRPPAGQLADELADVDPDAELATDGINLDEQLAEPRGGKLRQEQAVAALDGILAGFRQAGIAEFQRTDLVKAGALDRCDRSKGWLSGELGRRADAGQLFDVTGDRADGVYGWADALAGAPCA
jgi:hypothetical protein